MTVRSTDLLWSEWRDASRFDVVGLGQAALDQVAVVDEGVNRHQLHGGDAEALEMLANLLTRQTGDPLHDTQVHVHEAVGHPVWVDNDEARALTRADLATVRSTTGFAAGGTPPFGHATPVAVIADTALDDATLWIAAGTPTTVAAIGLAAEQVGGAQFVLEMAVQYAKDRVQFGRPIGSFQAIKHKCADMLLEVESAKSAAYYGLWCASEMNDELPSVASLAKAYCSEAYFHATAENIQIHGGIGFTWEHPAHLYFKRAKSSELLFGDPTYHREQLAQRIGI